MESLRRDLRGNLKKILGHLHYNLKIVFSLNILAAFVLVAVTPFLFSLVRLEYSNIATVGELYLSVIGIILLPNIINIEDIDNIKEVIYIRKTPHIITTILRLAIIIIFMFILISSIILLAKLQQGNFPFWEISLGSFISSLYFGIIGITVVNITKSLPSGYLIPFAYYAFEFSTRGKYTKDFFVFSLLNESFIEKGNLLLIIGGLLIVNLVIIYKRS
ncbi:hypothetical protein GOQ27_11155 [Clostridium sp. D2Q-11]|uniref:Uncharacterized protein n=1 Tax=Anaeromonas frigoriresistens TaxID=2683708 RepID=A0A942V0N8_9FIRM|nr:hypothetical protein [Anaeromonas frigoriresistens]MBS4539022.1 hypothetical protein [Anaeromonas frigoriresistens]